MTAYPDLLQLLRLSDPIGGAELLARLRVQRPTLSRATMMRMVRDLGDAIVSRGAARRTTYAARRPLRGNSAPIALYLVDGEGRASQVGRLDPVHPAGSALWYGVPLEWPLDAGMREGWFQGIPYPIDDMRPQGFIGRNFARAYGELLGVGPDPSSWPEDHVLHALAIMGSDCPGNLILGAPALLRHFDRMQRGSAVLVDAQLAIAYPAHARQAMDEGAAGSSAGGDFPKFGLCRERDGRRFQVLVKFSGNDGSAHVQRWADLLVCEHLALETITTHLQREAAVSRIHRYAGRTFLEVERFDREGEFGRSPACTWGAINGALLRIAGSDWSGAAARLLADGYIDGATARAMLRQWHFASLIADTDVGDGNLSFRPGAQAGMLALAPAYDMLPMAYAPLGGVELPEHQFAPALPLPPERDEWIVAAGAAMAFWQRAGADERISAGFRATCVRNRAEVARLLPLA